MAFETVSPVGSALQHLLDADDIVPGSAPSYQLCKDILAYHPLGQKIAEAPIGMAQSDQREISVPKGPEDRVVEAFRDEWANIGADRHIGNVARLARAYGVATLVVIVEGEDSSEPLDPSTLARKRVTFSVFDPLNTAGSLTLNQTPNAADFLKAERGVVVNGRRYHPSRCCVLMNEEPLYIEWTASAFGYVGRSVYQRALYPLKSFIQCMVTDNLITLKSGVFIEKLKQSGPIVNGPMQFLFGLKREVVKQARTGNVISIGVDEAIETLNMQNLDGAYGMARTNILKNIATAADMPAKLLDNETLVEGFGEGTEDAKNVARYIDRIRAWMGPAYDFVDRIVQSRAWSQAFFDSLKNLGLDGGAKDHETALAEWRNSFAAAWPSLLKEPESELIKVDDVRLKAAVATVQVLGPQIDPENRVEVLRWFQDTINENKILFKSPLNLDFRAIQDWQPPQDVEPDDADKVPKAPLPFRSAA